MTIQVRFAPSPTGFLHIGGARTALFNYLYAKKQGGNYLLRIEDTDQARSTHAAIKAIHDGLDWLGLTPDAPSVMQSANIVRHQEVVQHLLASGQAYHCYMTPEELTEARAQAQAKGTNFTYDRRWRDAEAHTIPTDIAPSVRLKAPLEGSITIEDAVQGTVSVDCRELDDMVLMRADGTPTYLLAVVVDDHDMGITHIIRGDDHFTNSFRQALIYQALAWQLPTMAHIPLIHGTDGAKLSKRHGALGVDAYREMGYLPEAMRNYLLHLGWSHEDDEIISDAQAITWFDLSGIGKSPARFDMDKLNHINSHYIRQADAARLCDLCSPFMEAALGRALTPIEADRWLQAIPELQLRATTLHDIVSSAQMLFVAPTYFTDKAATLIMQQRGLLEAIIPILEQVHDWKAEQIQAACETYGHEQSLKLGKIMNPIRAAITGSHASPSMFHIMPLIGKEASIARIAYATTHDITAPAP
ncbi:MAG: glutamate--tRNA ligase [Sphaerospermopsis sp. SIO1G2]|nr:glutamate--tRNA ligase [Sphaerospermopsis sp. SIO1G2]